MRAFVKNTLLDAAVRAGLAGKAVMEKPKKETVMLPEKRLHLEYLDQGLTYTPQRIARRSDPAEPERYRVLTRRLYKTDFLVRADIISNDETWLESFVGRFLSELPRKTADPQNNLIVIEAQKAVRKGFESKMVEVFKKRSTALHIRFKGMVCKDERVPLIRDVNIKDNTTYKE